MVLVADRGGDSDAPSTRPHPHPPGGAVRQGVIHTSHGRSWVRQDPRSSRICFRMRWWGRDTLNTVVVIFKKFRRPPHPPEKGKRTKSNALFKVLGKTKANAVAAVAGEAPVTVRRAQELGKLSQEPPRITRWPQLPPFVCPQAEPSFGAFS